MDEKKDPSFLFSVIDQNNQPTTTWHGAAASIHDFWTSFWVEHAHSIPDLPSRTDSLLDGVRVPEIRVNIKFPTGIELQDRAQSGTGTGGPDGWAADEIKHLPF